MVSLAIIFSTHLLYNTLPTRTAVHDYGTDYSTLEQVLTASAGSTVKCTP